MTSKGTNKENDHPLRVFGLEELDKELGPNASLTDMGVRYAEITSALGDHNRVVRQLKKAQKQLGLAIMDQMIANNIGSVDVADGNVLCLEGGAPKVSIVDASDFEPYDSF